MKLRDLLLLVPIVILSMILRFHELGKVPAGFTLDEASYGYDAYSLLQTGRDQWNQPWPLMNFRSFGDYKLPGHIYTVLPFVKIFGLTEFAVRLPSALAGILTVILTYFLAKEIFRLRVSRAGPVPGFLPPVLAEGSELRSGGIPTTRATRLPEIIALLSAFLLAIDPWHIFLNRLAHDINLGLFGFLAGLLFFLKSFKSKKYLLLSFPFWFYALWTSTSVRLLLPLFLVAILIVFRHNLKSKLPYFLFSLFLFLPLLTLITPENRVRLAQTNWISSIGIINDLNEQRGACQNYLPSTACQIFYNKPVVFATHFTKNYFQHFSASLLFLNGTPNLNGYAYNGRGLLYFYTIFLIPFGLFFVFRIKSPFRWFVAAWLFLWPLPSAITGFNNPGRMFLLLPLPQILSAFGLIYLLSLFSRRILKFCLIFLFLSVTVFSFSKFTLDYYFYYPLVSTRLLQYGYQPLFRYLRAEENNFEKIIISRRYDDAKQYIWYLFYNQYPPNKFQKEIGVTRYFDEQGWIRVDQINKYFFAETLPAEKSLEENSLLIASSDEFPKEVKYRFLIRDQKGDPLFAAVTGKEYLNYLKNLRNLNQKP